MRLHVISLLMPGIILTLLGVALLGYSGQLVEIEAIAALP